MKKIVTLVSFVTLIVLFIVYKSGQSRHINQETHKNLSGIMLVTQDKIEIPLDSVLKYYQMRQRILMSTSKSIVALDKAKSFEDAFRGAIEFYIEIDSIRNHISDK